MDAALPGDGDGGVIGATFTDSDDGCHYRVVQEAEPSDGARCWILETEAGTRHPDPWADTYVRRKLRQRRQRSRQTVALRAPRCSIVRRFRTFAANACGVAWHLSRTPMKIVADLALHWLTVELLKLSTVKAYMSRLAAEFAGHGWAGVGRATSNARLREIYKLAKQTDAAWVRKAKPIDAAFLLGAHAKAVRSGDITEMEHFRAAALAFLFCARVCEYARDGMPGGVRSLRRKDIAFITKSGAAASPSDTR